MMEFYSAQGKKKGGLQEIPQGSVVPIPDKKPQPIRERHRPIWNNHVMPIPGRHTPINPRNIRR